MEGKLTEITKPVKSIVIYLIVVNKLILNCSNKEKKALVETT